MIKRADTPMQSLAVLSGPVSESLLADMVQRIVAHLPACCVVLFGSHAYGTPREDSDVDLLVVASTEKGTFSVAGELYGVLRPRDFVLDIVVMTPQSFRERLSGFDPFLREVVRKGRVLHGRLP